MKLVFLFARHGGIFAMLFLPFLAGCDRTNRSASGTIPPDVNIPAPAIVTDP